MTKLAIHSALRRRSTGLTLAAVVLAVALGAWWWTHRTPSKRPGGTQPVPVIVAGVTTRTHPTWLTGVGTVQSLNVVNIRARVDGELQKVHFSEGQDVRAGAVLAQIDPRPYKAQLDQAQANLLKDQAQLGSARTELARYEKLAELHAAPTQNVDTFKAQAATLDASIAADRAQVETAKLQLGYTTLVSPIDGRTGLRQVDPGSIVRAADATGIVTVTQMKPIGIVFSLPQDALAVLAGGVAHQTTQVMTREGGQPIADGRLASIDNQVDVNTGQFRAKALFANDDGRLWPGQLVAIRILLKRDAAAIVIPSQAILSGLKGPYVYVVKADDIVEPRDVQVANASDGYTAIPKGLTAGERVVVEGQSRLAPGSKVAAKTDAANVAQGTP